LAKHIAKFLDDVKAGHEVLVTQGQTPFARLIPAESPVKTRRRSISHLKPLSGRWTGGTVLKSGELADEMFER
jgi:antitoxin (DNA-binding transcriptional repressor) of toxin-antitoxin stability system